jgi:hypothetical protein
MCSPYCSVQWSAVKVMHPLANRQEASQKGHLPYSRDGKHRWRFNWLLCHRATPSCSNIRHFYILLERPLNFNRESFLLHLHSSFPFFFSFTPLIPLSPSLLSALRQWINLYFYPSDGTASNTELPPGVKAWKLLFCLETHITHIDLHSH